MPELGDELRLLADQGAQQARPIPSAEVMACGDRRRRGRVMLDGFAAVTVAGAVAAGVVSGIPAGQQATLHHPETRPPAPLRSPTPTPAPKALRTPSPSPSPSSAPGQPAFTPSPSPHPTGSPSPSRTPSASQHPKATPSPEPSAGAP